MTDRDICLMLLGGLIVLLVQAVRRLILED